MEFEKKKITEPQPLKSSEKSINFSDYLGCKNTYHQVNINSRAFRGFADEGTNNNTFFQNCSKSPTRPVLDIPNLPDDLLNCNDNLTFPETLHTKAIGRTTTSNASAESFDLIELVHSANVYFRDLPPNMSARIDNSGVSPETIITVRVPKNLESSKEFYGVVYGHLVTIKEGGKTWFVCSSNKRKYSVKTKTFNQIKKVVFSNYITQHKSGPVEF